MLPKIKILVGYHKPATLFKSDVMVPMHLGRALATQDSKDGAMSASDYKWLLKNTIGDDTGDNISHLNRYYCEMTGIYWAWKNYDKLGNPDYIGFMHYRRHLSFNTNKKFKEICWGVIEEKFLDKTYIKKFHLTDDEIISHVKNYDVTVANKCHINPVWKTPYGHYKNAANFLHIEDYDIALKVLKDKYPEFAESADKYNNSNFAYFTNVFIMKKNIFNEYCAWVFDILNECKNQIDTSKYNVQEARVFGYISEWLCGIYITYLYSKNYKISELQRTLVQNTNFIKAEMEPAFEKNSVNICLGMDPNYLFPVMVTIKSIIKHSSAQNNYDIIILEEGLSDQDKLNVTSIIHNYSNFSIRFVNIDTYRERIFDCALFESAHIKKSAYNRLLIPSILDKYKKAIYIDCDLVLQKDIAKLFNINLLKKPLGAVLDFEIIRSYSNEEWLVDYINEIHLEPKTYFNSGVLLMDLESIRENFLHTESIKILRELKNPCFHDQDILNICYKDKVLILDPNWNFETHIPFWSPNYRSQMPEKYLKMYDNAAKNPWILHFTGRIKPWQNKAIPYAKVWWNYAKKINGYKKFVELKKGKKQICFTYFRYMVLSKVTWGKKRKHYKLKYWKAKHERNNTSCGQGN